MPPSVHPTHLAPQHCPADADGYSLLALDAIGCRERHQPAQAAQDTAVGWLLAAKAALTSGTLLALRLPHADPGQPSIAMLDIDPTTAHVVIAAGRRGVNPALEVEDPVLYAGVVAQGTSTRWHGLAGVYVPVCGCPEEARGWPAARRIIANLGVRSVWTIILPTRNAGTARLTRSVSTWFASNPSISEALVWTAPLRIQNGPIDGSSLLALLDGLSVSR